MRKVFSAFSFLSFVFVIYAQCYAQSTEQLTITTYYPSPLGSYHELESDILKFNPSLPPPPADWKEGMMYYDSGSHQLMVYQPLPDGTDFQWRKFMVSKEKVLGSRDSGGSPIGLPANGFGTNDTEPTLVVPAFGIDFRREGTSLVQVEWEGSVDLWVKP
ncbi:MAG: hypothetical protein NC916_00495, partial [Candidatus Omnitrophica bacterium]|nr:hypothetical protein [Candidatus Omnitrophota bacterium]